MSPKLTVHLLMSLFLLPHLFQSPQVQTRCVIYDRPPRTGSTVISNALELCLLSKSYALHHASKRPERKLVISKMLSDPGSKLAAVKSHMNIAASDIDGLKKRCHVYLYVTSTNAMPNRLLSALKYSVFKGHGNRTVSAAELEQAMEYFNPPRLKNFLEFYPCKKRGCIARNEFLPHYTIRTETMLADLIRLLNALRCNPAIIAVDNIHDVTGNLSRTRIQFPIKLGDSRHIHMKQLASQANANGLKLAHQL